MIVTAPLKLGTYYALWPTAASVCLGIRLEAILPIILFCNSSEVLQ